MTANPPPSPPPPGFNRVKLEVFQMPYFSLIIFKFILQFFQTTNDPESLEFIFIINHFRCISP